MMEDLTEDQLFEQVFELCQSKADEFAMLGYDNVTALDIWKCVFSGYKKELPAMHVLVNDILSLKITRYMNWLMVNMYKNPESI